MSSAVLSIGSNLGDRLAHLRAAVTLLGASVVQLSGVYETPPWGDGEQPPYLNAVVLVDDPTATASDWLTRAQACEAAEGRVRDPERRFGPRTLDVDVITVQDGEPVVDDDPDLTLPHPRAHLRAFVLVPWHAIRPDAELPGYGPIAALLDTPGVAADVAEVSPRPEWSLESME